MLVGLIGFVSYLINIEMQNDLENISTCYVTSSLTFIDEKTMSVKSYKYNQLKDSCPTHFNDKVPKRIPLINNIDGNRIDLTTKQLDEFIEAKPVQVPIDTMTLYVSGNIRSSHPFSCNGCKIEKHKEVIYKNVPSVIFLRNGKLVLSH
jgi:hypothetical protein